MIYHKILDAWPRAMFTLFVAATCLGLGRCAAERAAEDHYGKRVAQVLVYADSLKLERDSLKKEASEHSNRADSISRKANAQSQKIRERIVVVRDSFPALTHADTVRDALIDSLVIEADSWKEAYHAQKQATASLTKALKSAEAANDSMARVLGDYRPPKKPSRFSLGCTVGQGVNVWGAGPGATCGLSVRLL